MICEQEYAKVHLLDVPLSLDRAFDYFIPSSMRSAPHLRRGSFVTVPFGKGNRNRLGVVTDFAERAEVSASLLKPLLSVCEARLSLSEEMLGLCLYMKEHFLCTVGDAVRSMVPASAISRLVEIFSATSVETNEDFDESTLLVCEYIRKKGSVK